jgi:segregation and condensation protein B
VTEIDPALIAEAVIVAAGRPVNEVEIASHLPSGSDVNAILERLVEAYAGRGIVPVRTAGGWTMRTRPECSRFAVEAFGERHRLGRASTETSISIAIFGPVTRSEIERIRGVALSKGTMDALLVGGLIRPGPRRETPGRPLTWVVTERFLELHDIADVSEIPEWKEIREQGLDDLRRLPSLEPGVAEPEEEGHPEDAFGYQAPEEPEDSSKVEA